MSTPNPHTSSTITTAPATRPFTAATTTTTAKTPPPQPPPPPPSTQQQPPQRPLPSLPQHHHHPHQQQQSPHHLYTPQSLPIRLSNTTTPPPTNKPPHHPHLPHQDLSHGILYPLSSSGRGFIPKPIRPSQSSTDQVVTVANPGGYPPRLAYHHRPNGSPHLEPMNHPMHLIRPTHPYPHPHLYQHPHLGSAPALGSAPIKGIPVSMQPKVVPPPSSVSDGNGNKNLRERSKDDTLTVVRDRKVRISDGASLYGLCRSWLRNGVHEEIQRDYGDGVKSLPRPLPVHVADNNLPKKKEGKEEEEEEDEEEDEGSVEHLSADDLLKKHVKRAKRVRAQLREERLKRIARYKSRLALLLPPVVEQCRNDNA